MKIFIEKQNEHKEVHFTGTVLQLLQLFHINPETVIVSSNNELVTQSEILKETDDIKILSVISGG